MNCHPTFCGMLVEVEDGRLLKVSGDSENPDSHGFLCIRGHASREIIGNARRLLRPLVRSHRAADAWREAFDAPADDADEDLLGDTSAEAEDDDLSDLI